MFATLIVAVLATVSSLDTAAALGLGKCPPVAVRSDFNLTAFFGDWYEISVTPLATKTFEHDCSCTKASYAMNADGTTVGVTNTCNKDGVNGTLQVANGVAKTGAAPAKLLVRFSKLSPYANYWVIGGDAAERDYVVVWSCTSLLVANFQILWILARRPVLDAATYARAVADAKKALHGTGLTSQLTMTTQKGCAHTSSSAMPLSTAASHHVNTGSPLRRRRRAQQQRERSVQ